MSKDFAGHGIGRVFHQAPHIAHFANSGSEGEMKPGHVFTIEPCVTAGSAKNKILDDNVTIDGTRSAQFEHTIMITEEGHEVMTKRLEDSPPLDIQI